MVLAEAYHSSAFDPDYPLSPPYWHADMDPHSTAPSSFYPGHGPHQIYAASPQTNEINVAGPSIQGWVGQPQTPARMMGYVRGQKLPSEDVFYGQARPEAAIQQTPSLSSHRRPPPLVLDAASHSHPSSDLPQLTSQLVLEPVTAPPQIALQPTYATSSRSMGSSTRNSQGSLYGYDHASDASSSIGGMAPRAQTYETPAMGAVPAYTYQQLLPQYATQLHHAPSPSSSVNWSETYASAPSTSYSTSPVHSAGVEMIQPGNARSSVQYTQSIVVEPPTWTYQNVPVHVYPPEGPTSAPAQVTEMIPITSSRPATANQHVPVPGGMYLAASAPQVRYIGAPERGHVTPPKERTDVGPGPVRNRVRRKVAIGRVRLPEPEATPFNLTPTGGAEDPWKQMAQSQSLSGAFTHSGVYGVDPSMSADPTRPWTGEAILQPAPMVPVDSFPFGMAAVPIHRTTSIEGYYPPETATLYNTGSVSIPATVATSHVPLPLVSQLPPPLTMAPLTTSIMGTSMMQAGTPASLCPSTFSSDNEDPNDHLSSDPAYDDYQGGNPFAPAAHISSRSGNAPALQVATTNFDGFSRVPLVRTRTSRQEWKTEEDQEELQDVRSLGVHHALPSAAGSSSTSSTAGWPSARSEAHGRKRIIQRSATMGALPAHFDRADYSMYGAKNNRPKLAIACQGCREKKLKCSGERPTCMNCKRRGLEYCEYAESVRRRGPGRKKIAAMEKKANNEARRQAKARLQTGEVKQEDIVGQYLAMKPKPYEYQAQL